jgi:hypothetical protein
MERWSGVSRSLASVIDAGATVRLQSFGLCGENVPLSPPLELKHGDRLQLVVRDANGNIAGFYDLTQSEVLVEIGCWGCSSFAVVAGCPVHNPQLNASDQHSEGAK